METESADRDVDRCERAEDADARPVESDLFMRLAQRRVLERFAAIDGAARQRHLAAVAIERFGADGQHEVRPIVARKEQQQPGGMARERRVRIAGPWPRRTRRHFGLRAHARKRFAQGRLDVTNERRERGQCQSKK